MVTTHAKLCSHSDLVIDAIKPEQSAQAAEWVGLQLDESQHGVKRVSRRRYYSGHERAHIDLPAVDASHRRYDGGRSFWKVAEGVRHNC